MQLVMISCGWHKPCPFSAFPVSVMKSSLWGLKFRVYTCLKVLLSGTEKMAFVKLKQSRSYRESKAEED